jgi:hypothetical protein
MSDSIIIARADTAHAKKTSSAPKKKSATRLEWERTMKDLERAGVRITYWQRDSVGYRAYVMGFLESVMTALKKHDKRMGFEVFPLEQPDPYSGRRNMMIQHRSNIIRGIKVYPEQDLIY